MSHITTYKTKIKGGIQREDWIKDAIRLMAGRFPATEAHDAITFEQTSPDEILVRYKPIEVYQKRGNLRFVRGKDGLWQMQDDPYLCRAEVEKVREAFTIAYQQAGVHAFNLSEGYTETVETEKEKVRVLARMW